MTDVRGFTRYPNQRLKLVIGDHVARITNQDFATELDFRAAGVQLMRKYTQVGNIQFTMSGDNTIVEAGNIIQATVVADGTHVMTFSSDFVEYKNDFVGSAGTFDIWFIYMPDGVITYLVYERQ